MPFKIGRNDPCPCGSDKKHKKCCLDKPNPMTTSNYKRNHYVPKWYQYRFLPDKLSEKKFYYLDLKPDIVFSNKQNYTRKALLRWGPSSCFCEDDLYTTKFLD